MPLQTSTSRITIDGNVPDCSHSSAILLWRDLAEITITILKLFKTLNVSKGTTTDLRPVRLMLSLVHQPTKKLAFSICGIPFTLHLSRPGLALAA